MIELSPTSQSSVREETYNQHSLTATTSEPQLVRSHTVRSLDNNHNSAEHLTQQSSHELTSDLPIVRGPGNVLTFDSLPTWRAHHQDFYASKWFRSVLIYIIFSIIAVALVIFILDSPLVGFDPFSAGPAAGSVVIFPLPMLLTPVFFFLCIVIGGIFWANVFR